MPKVHLTIPADLLDHIDAAKPNFLDRKGFICLLLAQQLDSFGTLGGPSAAGTPSNTSIETSTNNSLIDISVVKNEIEAAEEPVVESQKRRKRKPPADGGPEFEAFWKQYLAIKHRANGQTKPAAIEAWRKVTKEITTAQLQAALTAAVNDQARATRDTGWAAPFPDCHRWLSKGYWQQHVGSTAEPLFCERPDFTPPPEFPDAPF